MSPEQFYRVAKVECELGWYIGVMREREQTSQLAISFEHLHEFDHNRKCKHCGIGQREYILSRTGVDGHSENMAIICPALTTDQMRLEVLKRKEESCKK